MAIITRNAALFFTEVKRLPVDQQQDTLSTAHLPENNLPVAIKKFLLFPKALQCGLIAVLQERREGEKQYTFVDAAGGNFTILCTK